MSDLIQIDPRAYKPFPTNYNTHPPAQIDELARSLAEFGQPKNVVCWRGHILAGHGLIEAAIKSNLPTIEARDVSDWPQEKAEAFLIADNETARMGVPDYGRLKALVEMAKAQGQQVPGVPGVTAERLAEIVAEAKRGEKNGNGKEPETPSETEAEKLARQYGVKVGQVWQLGKHKIIIADSTDEATRKDFVNGDEYLFTDPPYGIEIDTSWLSALHIQRGKPANLSDDKLQGDDGTLDLSFLFRFDKRLIWGFPYIFDPNATGWIVWDKQPGVSERGIVTPVELASTTLRKGFDMVRLMWGGFYRAAGEERHPHPTQKPMGVFLPFIEDWTKEGDKVFDPFLGSGTTLLSCEKLERICTGFDIHPPYAAIAIFRWQQMTQQEPRLV